MGTRLSGRLLMLQSNVSAVKRSFSSYLFLGCLFLCLFNWSFPVSPLPCRRHLPPLINRTYLHIFLKVPQSVLPIYTCQEVRVCVCVCLCVRGGGRDSHVIPRVCPSIYCDYSLLTYNLCKDSFSFTLQQLFQQRLIFVTSLPQLEIVQDW